MSEVIKEVFLPKKLRFSFGRTKILVTNTGWVFTIHKELWEEINCSEIVVSNEDETIVVDTMEREIRLTKGDILHFEYKLDVKFW